MAIGDGYKLNWKGVVALGEETTWGTAASQTAYGEFMSESLSMEREEVVLQSVNNLRTPSKRTTGNETVGGSIDLPVNPGDDFFVTLLKQCMGGTVSTALVATAGTYSHTLNVGDMESNARTSTASDTKGLTLYVRKGDTHVFRYSGCRVNQMTIRGESTGFATASFEITGKTATLGADTFTSITYTDIIPVMFHGISIKSAATVASVTAGTGTAETYQSFELTLNNSLQTDLRALGTRNLSALPQGSLNISLMLQQQFDTSTAYDRWVSDTTTAFGIFLDTNQTITAAGTTYSMAIFLSKAYLNYKIPEVTGRDGIVRHELSYTCLQDGTTTGYAIQMKVNNGTASY